MDTLAKIQDPNSVWIAPSSLSADKQATAKLGEFIGYAAERIAGLDPRPTGRILSSPDRHTLSLQVVRELNRLAISVAGLGVSESPKR